MQAAVLRPESGNGVTAARLEAAGLTPIRCPLFAVTPIAAVLPPLDTFDAVLLTSANAVQHGGAAITALGTMPVVAIGGATAAAARSAGLSVALTGSGDVVEAVIRARAAGLQRLLHLAGRDHRAHPGIAATAIVYASEPCPVDASTLAQIPGGIALLHSRRAAERFVTLLSNARIPHGEIALAVMSEAVAHAAGPGWRLVGVADSLTDSAMVSLAANLSRALGD